MFNVEDVVESALMDLGAFSVPAGRAGGSVRDNASDYDAELDAANLLAEEEGRDVTNVSNEDEDTNAIIRMTETTTARLISTLCKHDCCKLSGAVELALGFETMNKADRVRFLRSMLFALTSPAGVPNMLFTEATIATRKRRYSSLQNETNNGRETTCFFIKGQRVFLQTFDAIFNLSPETIRSHARDVETNPCRDVYETKHSDSRSGKRGLQRIIVHAYLMQAAADFGMECPRGRGSQDESPLRLLPSSYSKISLYSSYREAWAELLQGIISLRPGLQKPTAPIHYNLFSRYWDADMPTLRIATLGSDFCDTCTTLKNTLSNLRKAYVRYKTTKDALMDHLEEAKTEFLYYRKFQKECKENLVGEVYHLVFDFAEKVLLPKLVKQPGQLHFITGLKFDIFGVS